MASNSVMIKKLQTAINLNGGKLMYSTGQFYSAQQNRPVTVYSIKEAIYDDEKKKYQHIDRFKSTSQIQVVLYLRDYWFTMNGWEIPQDNPIWNEKKAKAESKAEAKEVSTA